MWADVANISYVWAVSSGRIHVPSWQSAVIQGASYRDF